MTLTADATTFSLLDEAMADPSVSEIILGAGDFVIDHGGASSTSRWKLFSERSGLTIRGKGVGVSRLIFSGEAGQWPALWARSQFEADSTDRNAGSRATGTVSAGDTTLTIDSGQTVPEVGEELLIYFGVDWTDPAEPHYRHYCRVTAVSGRTITFGPAVPESIPTYPEDTSWTLQGAQYQDRRDKIGAAWTVTSSGYTARGYGTSHNCRRFLNGRGVRNLVFRDFDIRMEPYGGTYMAYTPVVFQYVRDVVFERVNVYNAAEGAALFWDARGVRLRDTNHYGMRVSHSPLASTAIMKSWHGRDVIWSNSTFAGSELMLGQMEAGGEAELVNCTITFTNGRKADGSPPQLGGVSGRSRLTCRRCTITGSTSYGLGGADRYELNGTLARTEKGKLRLVDCTVNVTVSGPKRDWATEAFDGQLTLGGTTHPVRKQETKVITATLNQNGQKIEALPLGIYRRVFVPAQAGVTNVKYSNGTAATGENGGWRMAAFENWRGDDTYGSNNDTPKLLIEGAANATVNVQVEMDWWPRSPTGDTYRYPPPLILDELDDERLNAEVDFNHKIDVEVDFPYTAAAEVNFDYEVPEDAVNFEFDVDTEIDFSLSE